MKKFKIIIIIAAISALLIFAFNSCKTTPANCPDCPDPVIKTDTIVQYNVDTILIIETDTILEIDSIIIIQDPVYIIDTVFKSIIRIDTVELIVHIPEYILTIDTIYSVQYDTIVKLQTDTVYRPSGNIEYHNNIYLTGDPDSARNIDDPLLKEFFRKFDSVNHNN